MSTLPAVIERGQVASRYDDQEMIATIKQTVCKGASDAQLRMFIEVCKRTGLDPFLKEIWFVAEKSIIMAARDGYLRVANENPQFDGIETRVERDEKGTPIKAVCTVWRKDRSHPTISEAYFNEYRANSPVWSKYPSAMISKVAEVLALKRSFAINGVVSEEEMGASEDPRGSAEAAQAVAAQKIAALQATLNGATEAVRCAVQGSQAAHEMREAIDAVVVADTNPVGQSLHEDIQQFQPRTPRNPSKSLGARHIDMMQAFGALKKRYQALDKLPTYYAVLGRNGVEKSNQFPATDTGLAAGLAAYREMLQNVQELEALAAKSADVPQ